MEYINKLMTEQLDLKEKIFKLEEFINHDDKFKDLDHDDKIDMEDQLRAMMIYSDCLGRRISRKAKYL